ncbi:SGNH/GDSL hydrolase family protein [Thalassotalea atypica]|uniref:SGNH/GDSL hydrolase family protein n=1 Tax=Thalassotalea atypica TaxID=2054316 RepID=UPI002573457F|nr:SGNH/GDSL hydrolase family protein [Thalassotalea atypica]
MQSVLCFGDSNTWGYEPGTGLRFDHTVRWTALTQTLLNNDIKLYEAGLNGRTTNSDDAGRDFRCGSQLLNLYLESCRPLSLVIISLGTNDLKASLSLSVDEIKAGAKVLCEQVQSFDFSPYQAPQVLLVAPAPLVDSAALDEEFETALTASRKLAAAYFHLSRELGIHFLDAGKIVKTSPVDGVHWDADAHLDFARHLSALLPSIIDAGE